MGLDTRRTPTATGTSRVRRALRWVAIATGVTLAAVLLVGLVGFLLMWDATRCHSTDPEGLRLLQSLEIEDVRPAGGELAYGPLDPICGGLFFGEDNYAEPERSWSFDFADEAHARAAVDILVSAAEANGWQLEDPAPSDPFPRDQPPQVSRLLTTSVEGREVWLDIFATEDSWSDPAGGWRVNLDTTLAPPG